jgi:hypothetical protein
MCHVFIASQISFVSSDVVLALIYCFIQLTTRRTHHSKDLASLIIGSSENTPY